MLAVVAGSAPVLHEEEGQMALRLGEVVGIQGPEERIGGDSVVEALDEGGEERLTAPPLKKNGSPRNWVVK